MYLWSRSLYGLSLLLLPCKSSQKLKYQIKTYMHSSVMAFIPQPTCETPPQPQWLPRQGETRPHPWLSPPAEEAGSGFAVNAPLRERKWNTFSYQVQMCFYQTTLSLVTAIYVLFESLILMLILRQRCFLSIKNDKITTERCLLCSYRGV